MFIVIWCFGLNNVPAPARVTWSQFVSAPDGSVMIEGQAGTVDVAELVAEVSRLTEQVESLTSGQALDPLIEDRRATVPPNTPSNATQHQTHNTTPVVSSAALPHGPRFQQRVPSVCWVSNPVLHICIAIACHWKYCFEP